MSKLLVPLDGSECSLHALDHAIARAQQKGGVELHLLNVSPDPIMYGEIQVYVPVERMLELQKGQSQTVLAPAIEKTKAAAVPYETHIEHGDAATMIARRANDFDVDGIVMGTRGMGAIGNLLMGSVASKVVHLANVPVTLVK